VSLPHTLFLVKVPILQDGHALYEHTFALTDDDAALNVYRMGFGIPAKIANISFDAASGVHISRRGRKLFSATGLTTAQSASQADVVAWLGGSEIGFGTGANNDVKFFPLAYYRREVHPTAVRTAAHVDVGAWAVAPEGKDMLNELLPDSGAPVEALMFEGDLDVTAWMQWVERKPGSHHEFPRGLVSMWRDFGDTNDALTKEPRADKMAYQNGDIVWVHMRINSDAVTPYLPPGVALDGDEGLVYLVRWQPADLTRPWSPNSVGVALVEYNELWVMVPVKVEGMTYMLPLLILLDEDVAMMAGRDWGGCMKKLANTTYTFSPQRVDGADVLADINRRGRDVFRLTGRLGPKVDGKPVPGLDATGDDALPTLFLDTTQFAWDPEHVRPWWGAIQGASHVFERRSLEAVKVELGDAAPEPLRLWFSGPPTSSGYVRMDQDWLMSKGGAQMKPVELKGYEEWWRRSFAVLYM